MGNVVTVHKAASAEKLEKIHRKAGQELGLFSQMVQPPMSIRDTKRMSVLGTTSLAWYIGRAVYLAKQEKTDIMEAIVRTIVLPAVAKRLTHHRLKQILRVVFCTPERSFQSADTFLQVVTLRVQFV